MKNKTKHHEIDLSELQKFIEQEDVTFANSTRENKRLTISLNGTIKVFAAHKLIYQGTQTFPAVEAYNAVTEKYIDNSPKFKI